MTTQQDVGEVLTRLLDPSLFDQWLAGKPDDADVGRAGDWTACPLAQYLAAASEGAFTRPCVFLTEIYTGIAEPVEAPRWVSHFVANVDRGPRAKHVTAKFARFLLGAAREATAQ